MTRPRWRSRFAVWVRGQLKPSPVVLLAVAFAGACGDTTHDAGVVPPEEAEADAGSVPDGGAEADGGAAGTSPGGDADAAPDAALASDAASAAKCSAPGALNTSFIPVRGTIHGSRIDAVLCENGVGTRFLGPDAAAESAYAQSLFTTADASGSSARAFLVRMPDDVVSLALDGWVGATAPEVGSYASTDNCGWLKLEVTLPIPTGVVCPPLGQSCAPDCEPVGELGVCTPAYPKSRYTALPAAACADDAEPARGQWELMLTEVSAHAVPDTLINFLTHGRLTATLVNEEDPSDSVALELDF